MTDERVDERRHLDERSDLRELKTELTRFMMSYKFATDEMMTKINILKEEFSDSRLQPHRAR